MLQEVNNALKKPAAQPVQASAPNPQPPIPNPAPAQPAQNNTPHGNFFSGNILSKAFDVLRLPEFAMASYAKGARAKSEELATNLKQTGRRAGIGDFATAIWSGIKNIPKGISTRTQFGREEGDVNIAKDLTKNPYLQTGANLATSLLSPSLPIGKIAGIAGKIPGVNKGLDLATKIGGGIANTARNIPNVAKVVEKVPGLEYFRNPEVGKIIEGAKNTTAQRVSQLFNQINDVAKGLSKVDRVAIGNAIEGTVENLSPKFATRVNYIRGISDKIGKELVDLGVMTPETFAKYQGQYLSHIADTVRNQETSNLTGGALKFFLNSLKQRKDKLGTEGYPDYIREFQFPVFKSLAGEINTAESARAIKEIVGVVGQKVKKFQKTLGGPRVSAKGLVALQDLVPKKVAHLFRGVGVPQEVADYLVKTYGKNAPGLLSRVSEKALSYWKLGKTVYSGPAYHVRNIISNMILSDFSTGAGLPATLYGYGKAVKAYLGKGDAKMNQYIQELKDVGVIGRQTIERGIEELKPGVFGSENKLKNIANSPKEFQRATEETAKLNVYSHFRNQGASIEDAAKKAEEAIFSPYKLSETERGLVKGVIPFYSFTRQAVPFTAKTAIQHPERITKYPKFERAIEGLSPEGAENNTKLPADRRGQIRLPVKDKDGNFSYGDPTYIYPFGQFGEGMDFSRGRIPGGLSLNPLITETASQVFNKDLYFDQPIAKSNIPEKARAQRIQHAVQTFAPNILPTDFVGGIPADNLGDKIKARGGSKLYDAFTGQPDYAGRTRSKVQAILDTFGLKSSVFRPGEQAKFDNVDKSKQSKAIQSEIRSVLMNKSISPQDKKEIIKRLREVQRDLLKQ